MSTLSGVAPKGEKGRPKFQSLNINTLYRGESLETHQQKNVPHQRKHGMQNLGKIPAARRAPANLPSLKSEHSGLDPAYSLVPTGGSGWGSKPGEVGPPPPPSTSPPTTNNTSSTPTPVQSSGGSPPSQNGGGGSGGAAPAAAAVASSPAAAPLSSTATPPGQPPPPPAAAAAAQQQLPPNSAAQQLAMPFHPHHHQQQQQQQQSDKSWSAVTSTAPDAPVPSFLAHQSPHFQAQFPLLPGETPPGGAGGGAGGSGAGSKASSGGGAVDLSGVFGGPGGPSLRPQTEGSWSQGGRPTGGAAGSQTPSAAAQGPLGGGGGGVHLPAAQAGLPPNHHLMSHLRGVLPPFMLRQAGPFPPSFQGGPGGPVHGPSRPRFAYMPDSRMMGGGGGGGGAPRPGGGHDADEIAQRPIIKEEDLNRMDDIARDTGWATQDDIDYNQKLAFSDDETNADDDSPAQKQSQHRNKQSPAAAAGRQDTDRDGPPPPQRGAAADVSMDQQRRDDVDERKPVGSSWQQHARPSSAADYHAGPGSGSFTAQPHMRNSVQQGGRVSTEEDEMSQLKREEVAFSVEQAKQRAKQRKEVEEKRYEETKQAAAKKLLELNEKTMKNSSNAAAAQQQQQQPEEGGEEWGGPPHSFRPNRKPADGPLSAAAAAENFRQMTQASYLKTK